MTQEHLDRIRNLRSVTPLDIIQSPFVTLLSPKPNFSHSWAEGSLGTIFFEQERNEELKTLFPDWSPEDRQRVIGAELQKGAREVVARLATIRKPSDPKETKEVMLIAAQGFISAEGVNKIEEAMREANNLGVPIVHLNAITSADFTLEAEVKGIARRISDTMATACELSVPKVTYVLGEAASAGAHAGLHLLDEIHVTENALLTVIRPEAAFELLGCHEDVFRRMRQKLQEEGNSLESINSVSFLVALDLLKHRGVRPGLLGEITKTQEHLGRHHPGETMLIMAADEGKYVRGMYLRGADSITLHTDVLDEQFIADKVVDVDGFLNALSANWQRAIKHQEHGQRTPEIFLRISENLNRDSKKLWTDRRIKNVLKKFGPLGLTGIRLTPESSTYQGVSRIARLCEQAEGEQGIPKGTFSLCLSVEDHAGINEIENVLKTSTRITKVIMGVRDFTRNLPAQEFSTEDVNRAKKQLVAATKRLHAEGRDIKVLFSCVSDYRDVASLRLEVFENRSLGADGVLVIGPDQLSWAKAIFAGIVDTEGNIQEGVLEPTAIQAAEKLPNFDACKALYRQAYEETMDRIVTASHADPQNLLKSRFAESIITETHSPNLTTAILEHAFGVLVSYDNLSKDQVYRKRHERLAALADSILYTAEPIDPREGNTYKEIVCELIDDPKEFEPVGNNLYPQIPTDILAALGRVSTMKDLLQESQEKTKTPAGIVAGFGSIGGTEVLLIVRDPDFINATAGAATGAVIRKILEHVIVRKRNTGKVTPVVFVDTSAGGRVQEGVYGLLPSELAVERIIAAKQEGIRFFHVARQYVLGSDAIGPYYQGDHLIILGKDTQIGLAGERLVFASSPRGQREFPPGFRRGDYHMKMGNVDALVDNLSELRTYLERVLPSPYEEH